MSELCKIGILELEKARRWCVTHNQMMHFCDPDPRSEAGTMKRAREMVTDFWRTLPDSVRELWLLEGPCESLIENVFTALRESTTEWRPIDLSTPPIQRFVSGQGWQPTKKPYVLAVDAKGRTSVGYAMEHSGEQYGYRWTFAKPIGTVTHWMPLPDLPEDTQ